MNKIKKRVIIIAAIVVIIGIAFGVCAIYVNDYYRADIEAINKFVPTKKVSEKVLEDGTMLFGNEDSQYGFIFYPGGKVEYTAYTALMREIAANDVFCVLVEMPFNLAVLDINAAKGIQEQYPNVKNWYIGGHSLGGSMAAAYLGENADEYEGLILLGSYSTENLSDTDIEVLSIYGSEDKVLNASKYEENVSNLPADFTEIIIEGGCHAYFGIYGAQDGDGIPSISNEKQIYQTADEIIKMMKE
jgi:dienelactone hydrolase